MAYQPTSSVVGNRDPPIRAILRQYRRAELASDDSGYGHFSPIRDTREAGRKITSAYENDSAVCIAAPMEHGLLTPRTNDHPRLWPVNRATA